MLILVMFSFDLLPSNENLLKELVVKEWKCGQRGTFTERENNVG